MDESTPPPWLEPISDARKQVLRLRYASNPPAPERANNRAVAEAAFRRLGVEQTWALLDRLERGEVSKREIERRWMGLPDFSHGSHAASSLFRLLGIETCRRSVTLAERDRLYQEQGLALRWMADAVGWAERREIDLEAEIGDRPQLWQPKPRTDGRRPLPRRLREAS